MAVSNAECWGIYGGAGFIGQHLALSILRARPDDRVVLLDIADPRVVPWKAELGAYSGAGRLRIAECDVRDAQAVARTAENFDVMVNLAAVHREPGHRPAEYFDTNVAGARHLCALAERSGCEEMVFTSSIAVYGEHARAVDERDRPAPRTPYGRSKHEAEEIHSAWTGADGRRLLILRPGVVFGPGENGNVTRLMREMLHRNRPIRLQPDQPKAGIYIDELVQSIHWLRARPGRGIGTELVNGVSPERLGFNAFGESLLRLGRLQGEALRIPGRLLQAAVTLSRPLSPLFPSASKYHPERVAKLLRANDIRPHRLQELGYPFAWTLDRALTDWLQRGL